MINKLRSPFYAQLTTLLLLTAYSSLAQGEEQRPAAPSSSVSGDVEKLIGEAVPPAPPGYPNSEGFFVAIKDKKLEPVNLKEGLPGVKITPDVEFAAYGDDKLTLDLFQPEPLEGTYPGLILIHGGGWKNGSKEDYRRYGCEFAKRGYVAVSINYRMSPDFTYPVEVQDCKAAVRWMRAHAAELHVDPDHIGVMGGSAGGHLWLMTGYITGIPELEGTGGNNDVSSRVQAVVDIYGPSDLTVESFRKIPLIDMLLNEFMGGPYADRKDVYREASPVQYISGDDPPTLILHGTADNLVPVEQSDLLVEKLQEAQVPYVYDRADGWPHGMDFGKPMYDRTVWLADKFLSRALRPEAKPSTGGSP